MRQPQAPATVQPQVDVHPQPLNFSADMSNEQPLMSITEDLPVCDNMHL